MIVFEMKCIKGHRFEEREEEKHHDPNYAPFCDRVGCFYPAIVVGVRSDQ